MSEPRARRRRGGRRRRMTSCAIALTAVLGATACGDLTELAVLDDGGTRLLWGEDVLAAGRSVAVTDSIGGDAMVAGGELRMTGAVDGSYLGAGGDQRISGRVGGSVRAAGGEVEIDATVERNVTVAGGTVRIAEPARIGRNAYLVGGEIEVRGSIDGSLRVRGEEVTLDGPVLGDVEVEAGRLSVGPGAAIGGDLRYRVEEGGATFSSEAEIAGEVTAGPPLEAEEEDGGGTIVRVLRILAFLVAGGVAVVVLPNTSDRALRTLREETLASLGVGVLVTVLLPIVAAMIALTVIGLPLALIVALVLAIALYLAAVPPSLWLGSELLSRWRPVDRRVGLLEFVAGGAVIGVVGFVPIVGIVVKVLVALVGLGAVGLVLRRARVGSPASG